MAACGDRCCTSPSSIKAASQRVSFARARSGATTRLSRSSFSACGRLRCGRRGFALRAIRPRLRRSWLSRISPSSIFAAASTSYAFAASARRDRLGSPIADGNCDVQATHVPSALCFRAVASRGACVRHWHASGSHCRGQWLHYYCKALICFLFFCACGFWRHAKNQGAFPFRRAARIPRQSAHLFSFFLAFAELSRSIADAHMMRILPYHKPIPTNKNFICHVSQENAFHVSTSCRARSSNPTRRSYSTSPCTATIPLGLRIRPSEAIPAALATFRP